ncbi:MAG: hypothetical protein HY749_01840 [Gammaproteobacteria bacterium]|nr:hypothetical protein [Gammaproteobacteria bacterium]MBI5618659.1 hypothetical protein [Gammaproteobacteria bacterium]
MPLVNTPTQAESEPRDPSLVGVWAGDSVLVMAHQEGDAVRLAMLSTELDGAALASTDAYSFDELQQIKREVGYGDRCAVEIYPADADIVGGPAARHLWVLPPGHRIRWGRNSGSLSTDDDCPAS